MRRHVDGRTRASARRWERSNRDEARSARPNEGGATRCVSGERSRRGLRRRAARSDARRREARPHPPRLQNRPDCCRSSFTSRRRNFLSSPRSRSSRRRGVWRARSSARRRARADPPRAPIARIARWVTRRSTCTRPRRRLGSSARSPRSFPRLAAAGASVTAVSAAVDLHNLLCETSDPADAPSRAEADVVRAHAAALDDYVAHVESLAESSRPDPSKRAAAILLGQLCRDSAPAASSPPRAMGRCARRPRQARQGRAPDPRRARRRARRSPPPRPRRVHDGRPGRAQGGGHRRPARRDDRRAMARRRRDRRPVPRRRRTRAHPRRASRPSCRPPSARRRPRANPRRDDVPRRRSRRRRRRRRCVGRDAESGRRRGLVQREAPSPTPPPRGAPSRDESPSPRTMFSTSHFAARNRRTRPRPRARRYSRPERPKLRRLSAATRTPPVRGRRRARGVSRDASVGVSRRASPRSVSERRRRRPRGCGFRARDARGESRRRRRRGGARITFGGDSRRDARGVPRVTRRRRESHDGARALRRRDDRATRGCGRARVESNVRAGGGADDGAKIAGATRGASSERAT